MAATDLMDRTGTVLARTTVSDGRGGTRVTYTPRPGPDPDDPAVRWPLQLAEPSTADRLAAGNDVARIDARVYLPPQCPVARRDRIVVDGEPAGNDTWSVEVVVRPTRTPYVKALCSQNQDEGGTA